MHNHFEHCNVKLARPWISDLRVKEAPYHVCQSVSKWCARHTNVRIYDNFWTFIFIIVSQKWARIIYELHTHTHTPCVIELETKLNFQTSSIGAVSKHNINWQL